MDKRFVLFAVVLGLMLIVAAASLQGQSASIFQVFFWLLVLLVVSGLALWPRSAADQETELRLERRGWADRVDFASGDPGGDRKRATPARGKPSSA